MKYEGSSQMLALMATLASGHYSNPTVHMYT